MYSYVKADLTVGDFLKKSQNLIHQQIFCWLVQAHGHAYYIVHEDCFTSHKFRVDCVPLTILHCTV